MPNEVNQLRIRYLQKVYDLTGGNTGKGANRKQLDTELGITEDEDMAILNYLAGKGLAHWHSPISAGITAKGIDEVERIMAESYAEKERRVLRRIYDLGGPSHTEWVLLTDLSRDIGISTRELYQILNDLEHRKGLIGSVDQAVWMVPAGIELIESGGQRTGASTPGASFTTNIHGHNYGGIQQGGQGNTQNITLTNTNNPDFDSALATIVEMIRASSMPDDDKKELEDELGKVNKLALKEPTPGLLEKAKSRLDMVKLGLQGTELALKAAPHLGTAWEFLRNKFGG